MVIPSVLLQVAALVVKFSLTLLSQERIPIWDEQFVMEIWNNVVLLWRSVQVDNIDLFTRYAIGKLLDNRFDIDKIKIVFDIYCQSIIYI